MSNESKPAPGAVARRDLTGENTVQARDFSAAVVGWNPETVRMGGDLDFSMTISGSGEPSGE